MYAHAHTHIHNINNIYSIIFCEGSISSVRGFCLKQWSVMFSLKKWLLSSIKPVKIILPRTWAVRTEKCKKALWFKKKKSGTSLKNWHKLCVVVTEWMGTNGDLEAHETFKFLVTSLDFLCNSWEAFDVFQSKFIFLFKRLIRTQWKRMILSNGRWGCSKLVPIIPGSVGQDRILELILRALERC